MPNQRILKQNELNGMIVRNHFMLKALIKANAQIIAYTENKEFKNVYQNFLKEIDDDVLQFFQEQNN